MIQAIDIRKQLAFALDAEGSDHYMDDTDYIPAINASIKWLTAVVNSALSQNKLGEEFFREIAYSGVFQLDSNSRLTLNAFPNEVWTILAVYFNPKTMVDRNERPFPPGADDTISFFRRDLIHLSAEKSCKRLSVEEWAKNKNNPLESGYDGTLLCDELKQPAYLNPFNYNHVKGVVGQTHYQEIEVRPKTKFVTVFWVKKPANIVTINDNVEFPNSCLQLLFEKALNYISYKQGDQTNIYTVSERDINDLLRLM